MTLILSWVTKQFAVACCDGKSIDKYADGRIETTSEHCTKLHRITDDILIAAGGDADLGATLARCALEGTTQIRESYPEYLFTALEHMVPMTSRTFCSSRTYEVPQEHAVFLIGFDPRNGRMRGVAFDSTEDFEPVEIPRHAVAIEGYEDGKMLADELVDITRLTDPEATIEEFTRVIREVGRRFPERVNGNVSSIALRAPAGVGTGGIKFKTAGGGEKTCTRPN